MPDVNAFTSYENHRMEAMERHAAPLHWLLIVTVIAVGVMGLAGVFEVMRENLLLNEMMDSCRGGSAVYFDDV